MPTVGNQAGRELLAILQEADFESVKIKPERDALGVHVGWYVAIKRDLPLPSLIYRVLLNGTRLTVQGP